ncbi:MAG: hypothetical protein RL357_1491 [Pseudomonadota bacterium]|jgi:general secretion pathway protein I
MKRRANGFTLIEVLVALSIVAIALMAGFKATASLSQNAARQDQSLLAQMCAENTLIELRLRRQLPGIGNAEKACQQGQMTFQVTTSVLPTPNPNFLRLDVRVNLQGDPIAQVSTILGRN